MHTDSPAAPKLTPSWRDRLVYLFRRNNWRGFTRIYDLLKPKNGRRTLHVVSRYGTHFYLNPFDSVDNHVINEGFYESEVLESVRPFLAARDAVLWVVGANFGLHAITAKYLHPTADVIAFEPSPAMAARFIENCDLNRASIDLHVYPLSNQGGILKFYANASGNPGMSTLHPVNRLLYDHLFNVVTVTAAQVIASRVAKAPTAIIIDAEGAEEEIIQGLGNYILSPSLNVIVFEAENSFLNNGSRGGLHKSIAGAGFRISKLERRENTAHNLSNFIALRSVS